MRDNGPIELMKKLSGRLQAAQIGGFIDTESLEQLNELIIELEAHQESAWEDSRHWLANLMMFNPQLAPAVDRELLWILGGDCLHSLTDEELNSFQQQEELH
jgi:hypothetical protein